MEDCFGDVVDLSVNVSREKDTFSCIRATDAVLHTFKETSDEVADVTHVKQLDKKYFMTPSDATVKHSVVQRIFRYEK